jgi:hypothetical protein
MRLHQIFTEAAFPIAIAGEGPRETSGRDAGWWVSSKNLNHVLNTFHFRKGRASGKLSYATQER